jgi:hypothetical protein
MKLWDTFWTPEGYARERIRERIREVERVAAGKPSLNEWIQ